MNRNVESHFALTAGIDIQRSTFDRSQDVKFTFDVGQCIPFYVDECLPGDTHKITTSKVVRLQTLLTPVMDNIYLDTYYFFVPYRLVWQHWREFMGENTQSAWLPQVEYTIPQMRCYYYNTPDNIEMDMRVKPGDFADYMGVPVNVPLSKGTATSTADAVTAGEYFEFSALPYRAYVLIWNEWFRDENLQDPKNFSTGDANQRMPTGQERNGVEYVYRAGKYHDYFTSALPSPLKAAGPVLAPIESSNSVGIPVGSKDTDHNFSTARMHLFSGSNKYLYSNQQFTSTNSNNYYAPILGNNSSTDPNPLNLYGDVSSLGINIMSLRNAFQVQKFLERDARAGTRYTEIIKGHFNVNSPDSRLQRPEYLGGNRIPISIHQITNQSQGENDFLGDLGAMSLTTDRNEDFTYSCTEHGVIIGICVARYDHSYPQGLERFWSRKTRYDFYWPEFAHLSEMAILNQEIYAQGIKSDDEAVFGYQEAYGDYRYKPNRVAGEMRPGISNTLASWHFADNYVRLPTLSDAWIKENKTNVDRTLAVTSAVANQCFADFYIQNYTTRPMPVRSIPGLADHF